MERNPENMNPQIAPFLPMEAKLACGFIMATKLGNAAFHAYKQRTIIAPPQTALSLLSPSGSCLHVRISLIHDCTCATQGFPLHWQGPVLVFMAPPDNSNVPSFKSLQPGYRSKLANFDSTVFYMAMQLLPPNIMRFFSSTAIFKAATNTACNFASPKEAAVEQMPSLRGHEDKTQFCFVRKIWCFRVPPLAASDALFTKKLN